MLTQTCSDISKSFFNVERIQAFKVLFINNCQERDEFDIEKILKNI